MGTNAAVKWLVRAERYEELLRTKGRKEAKKYLNQFEKNMDRILAALWENRGIKEEEEAEYQAEIARWRGRVKKEEESL